MEELLIFLAESTGQIFISFLTNRSRNKFKSRKFKEWTEKRTDHIEIRPVPIDCNDENRAITKERYSWDHPLTSNLRERGKGKEAQFIYEFWDTNSNEKLGYTIIYPINQNCVNKFLNQKYTSGSQILNKDIKIRLRNAAGYYIAYLIAFEDEKKGLVASKCSRFVSDLLEVNTSGFVHVFTKPTENTITLLEKNRFEPIGISKNKFDSIYKTDTRTMIRKSNEIEG